MRAGAWHYRIFPGFLNSGFKMSSKIEEQKQWSLHSVETMLTVLTGRLLHKGTILQKTTVVLLQKKERLSLLGSIGGLLNCSTKKFEQKTVE